MHQKLQQRLITLLFLLNIGGTIAAQNGNIKWQRAYGSGKNDVAKHIIQNKQGQFVVVGTTGSWLFGNDDDISFTVLDSTGTRLSRAHPIGGRGTEGASSVVQTRDGGYVIAGFTESANKAKFGKRDAWLIKVDETGTSLWKEGKVFGTDSNDEFTDVTEAPNGDLWMTGESDGKLWVVKADEHGKSLKEVRLSLDKKYSARGNGLAWSSNGRHLLVVGTRVFEGQQDLLIAPFDTEGGDFLTEKTLEKAEGQGIVRDEKGNFGIVGTSHDYTRSDILFTYYDEKDGFMTKPTFFGGATNRTNDIGWGIAEDADGNFIIVGESFDKNKPQGWMHKIDADGKPIWDKAKRFGGDGEDIFYSVVVADGGYPVAVGKTFGKLGKDAWVVAVPPSVFLQNPNKINLNITAGRFHDSEDSSFLGRSKRGFYDFWIENRDTDAVFGLLATVHQTAGKHKANINEYNRIHIGTLRGKERRLVTVPFSSDYSLQRDEWDFELTFSAQKRPLSIEHTFHVSTRDTLKHKLIASYTFPSDIQAGKRYDFTFTVKNEGDLTANNVELFIAPETGTRIKIMGKDRIKLDDLAIGESQTVNVSFEVEREFYANVLLVPVFVKLNGEIWGKKYVLSSRLDKREPPQMRLIWKNPISSKDTVLATTPNYPLELIVESEVELNRKEHVKIFINGRENKGEKFDGIKLSEIENGGVIGHRYLMTFDAYLPSVGASTIQIDVHDGKKTQQTKLILKRVNPPNLYLLAVGVDYSKNKKMTNLSYTGADALSIDSILSKTQKGKLFNDVNTIVLADAYKTRASYIKQQLKDLANNCKETDVFIVLFSGHGQTVNINGSEAIWFLGADFEPDKRENYLDYDKDIKSVLDAAKGQKLLFLDACQTKVPKSGVPETEERQLSSAISDLVKATPTFRALLSCSANQSSWESENYGHGIFTQAILEAFYDQTVPCIDNEENCNANAPLTGFDSPDHVLTFRELTRFIKKRVVKMSEKMPQLQNPTERDKLENEDIPIFWYDK